MVFSYDTSLTVRCA